MSRNINNRFSICKLHPQYKAIYKPKVKCQKCEEIYRDKHYKKPIFDPTINLERH